MLNYYSGYIILCNKEMVYKSFKNQKTTYGK